MRTVATLKRILAKIEKLESKRRMKRTEFSVMFGDRRIHFDNTEAVGWTSMGKDWVWVKPTKGKSELDTFCHECFHILDDKLTEDQVVHAAGFLATVLWQAGYRKMNEPVRRSHSPRNQ